MVRTATAAYVSVATASAAAPSPRPTKPIPSPVVAFTLTEPRTAPSDAHVPDQLGFEYERAAALLESVGVGEIAVFERRGRRMEPLG